MDDDEGKDTFDVDASLPIQNPESPSNIGGRRRRSTLMQETGRILECRVAPITRQIVEQRKVDMSETVRLNNERIRKKIKKRFNDIHLRRIEAKHKQEEEWRLKTATSPFRLDLNEVARVQDKLLKETETERKRVSVRNEQLRAMTGRVEFEDGVGDRKCFLQAPSSSGLARNCLLQRAHQKDLKVLHDERSMLEHVIANEIEQVERQIPRVALMRAHGTLSAEEISSNSLIRKQKISGEKAREIMETDMRVYSAAGRYNTVGEFVLKENLNRSVMTAKYAQAGGKKGPITNMRRYESFISKSSSSSISATSYSQGEQTRTDEDLSKNSHCSFSPAAELIRQVGSRPGSPTSRSF